MSDRSKYMLGPGPRPRRRRSPAATDHAFQAITSHSNDTPTYWLSTIAAGVRTDLVVNPNTCEICHKRPHSPTPHHAFQPDRLPEATARRLGWPIPPKGAPSCEP